MRLRPIVKAIFNSPLSGGGSGGGSSFVGNATFLGNNKSRAAFDLNAFVSGLTISGLTLSTSTASNNYFDARTDVAITGGKIYFEMTLGNLGGSFTVLTAGMCDPSYVQNVNIMGSESPPHSFGVAVIPSASTYRLHFNGSFTTFNTGSTPVTGQVIQIAIDIGNQNVWARVQGTNWNNSGTANPATNTGGISLSSWLSSTSAIDLFLNGQINNSDSATALSATYNWGATTWASTPPSGFI